MAEFTGRPSAHSVEISRRPGEHRWHPGTGPVDGTVDRGAGTDHPVVGAPPAHGGGRRDVVLMTLPGVLLSAALTGYHYSSKPMWRDEWFTYNPATHPWPDMVQMLSVLDGGLAVFYAVMHAWMTFGDSVAWMRLLPALCTVALTVPVALIGRRLGGSAVGASAGALVALVPAVVDHAQEARAYPLVLLATATAGLAVLGYRDHPTRNRLAWLAVTAALAAGLHPLPGVPAVAGILAGALLAPGASSRPRLVLAGIPAAALGTALIGVGLVQQGLADPASGGGAGTLLVLRFTIAPTWWLFGVIGLLAALGAVDLAWQRRGEVLVLLGWAVVPVTMISLLTVTGSFFKPRYVSTAVPVAVVLAACGAAVLARSLVGLVPAGRSWWRQALPGTILVVVTAVVVSGLIPSAVAARRDAFRTDDPRAAAASMAAQWRQGDAVVYSGSISRGLVTFYAPRGSRFTDPLQVMTPARSSTMGGTEVPAPEQVATTTPFRRLWVVGTRSGPRWTEQTKVDQVTAGRTEADHEEFGAFWLERWDAP